MKVDFFSMSAQNTRFTGIPGVDMACKGYPSSNLFMLSVGLISLCREPFPSQFLSSGKVLFLTHHLSYPVDARPNQFLIYFNSHLVSLIPLLFLKALLYPLEARSHTMPNMHSHTLNEASASRLIPSSASTDSETQVVQPKLKIFLETDLF